MAPQRSIGAPKPLDICFLITSVNPRQHDTLLKTPTGGSKSLLLPRVQKHDDVARQLMRRTPAKR